MRARARHCDVGSHSSGRLANARRSGRHACMEQGTCMHCSSKPSHYPSARPGLGAQQSLKGSVEKLQADALATRGGPGAVSCSSPERLGMSSVLETDLQANSMPLLRSTTVLRPGRRRSSALQQNTC